VTVAISNQEKIFPLNREKVLCCVVKKRRVRQKSVIATQRRSKAIIFFWKILIDKKTITSKINSMSINKEWHLAHPMPPRATIEQRIHWHVEHLKNCGCRTDIPLKLRQEMKKRKIKLQ
jgi:hypothetical protein